MTDAACRPDADARFADFVASRDPAAMAAVFDATAPQLLLVAMHLTGDAADAEDLVQQTFLEAIRGSDRFEPGRRVLPWLLTILERRAIDRRRRRRPRADSAALEAWTANGPTPVDAAARAETAEIVATALDGLPARYHHVLTLRFVHGLNVTEIAGALRRPVGTVHAQIHRGLALLRRALPKEIVPVVTAVLLGRERGIAAVRAAVLTAVPAPVAATAAGGIGAMGWIASAVLAGVTMTVWWLWPAPAKLAQAPAATTSVGQTDDAADPAARTELLRTVATSTPEAPLRERSGAPPPDPDDPDAIRFSGRVVAAESGEPLAGVEVSFQQDAILRGPGIPRDVEEVMTERLVTVADGRFDFVTRRRFGTEFSLRLRREDRVWRHGSWVDREPERSSRLSRWMQLGDVTMYEGARLVGHIVDARGLPSRDGVDAPLEPSMWLLPGSDSRAGTVSVGYSDTNGVIAHRSPIPPGTWPLQHDGKPVLAPQTITVQPSQHSVEVTIRIDRHEPAATPAATIEGHLVDARGAAIPNVLVGAWPEEARSWYAACRTGGDGRFVLQLRNPDDRVPMELRVAEEEPHGWTTLAPTGLVRWGEVGVNVVARAPQPVELRVIDGATGEPVTRYGLRVGPADGPSALVAFGEHPEGLVSLGCLAGGTVDLTIVPARRDLRIATRRVEIPDDRRIRVELGAGAPVAVRVTRGAQPVVDARVRIALCEEPERRGGFGFLHLTGDPRAWFSTGHGSRGTWTDDAARTDATGAAEVHMDLGHGPRGVFVEDGLSRPVFAALPPDRTPGPVHVELAAAGAVRGRMLHPDIARSIDATLELVREVDGDFQKVSSQGEPQWANPILETDGTFEVAGLQPGRYRLGFDGNIVTEPPTILEVRAGEFTDVVFDPSPLAPGQLTARIVVNGEPITPRESLRLLRLGEDGRSALWPRTDEFVVHADGRVHFPSVPAGLVLPCTKRKVAGKPLTLFASQPIRIEPGGRQEAIFELQVRRVRLELRRADGTLLPPDRWRAPFDAAPIVGDARDCAIRPDGGLRVVLRSGPDPVRLIPAPFTWFRDGATLVERVVTLED